MSEFFYKGLRFAFKRSASPVAYCSLTILSGTRNEEKRYGGLSHLIEYTIFKGTKFRSANTINSCIEKLGGELNAYTTKEEIVIHSTVLKEDLSKAAALLVELAFCPVFPEKEVEKEKTVVLDEINSYKDSPSDQIFDDFEEYLFEGTDLSMPVLGKSTTLKKIKVETLKQYVNEHFIPCNMAFTVVADMEEKIVKGMLLKILKKYVPQGETPQLEELRSFSVPGRQIAVGHPFTKTVVRRSHQTHCIIGAPAYSYYDSKRMALILLVNILGGPATNAKLNLLLREKNALVYNVEASFGQYSDTGVVTIYFGCDKIYFEKCVKLVEGELAVFREKLMTQRALSGAKKQLLGQLAISSDNGEAQCLSMGKSLLVFGRVLEMDEIKRNIEGVTAQDVQNVANEIFAQEKLSKLMYL